MATCNCNMPQKPFGEALCSTIEDKLFQIANSCSKSVIHAALSKANRLKSMYEATQKALLKAKAIKTGIAGYLKKRKAISQLKEALRCIQKDLTTWVTAVHQYFLAR